MRRKDFYYSIPLKLDQTMRGKQLEHIEIKRSIHQNIRLIIKTLTTSYRFDPEFGSLLSKYHARTPPQRRSERLWREEMREAIQNNLKDMLKRYETRLEVTDVMVDLQEPVKTDSTPLVRVKVDVVGQLTLGRRDQFHYPDSEIEEDAQEAFPLVIPMGRK